MLPHTFHTFHGFIGVIEWPEREPDVIVAATAHEVRLEALTYILTTDLDGTPHFAFDFEDDVSLFVTDNPLPRDLTDIEALKEWHEALKEATLQPVLTTFGPQSDPAENVYAWDRAGKSSGFHDQAARETPSASVDPALPGSAPEGSQR